LLRWFWWRINAWTEVSAMAASFAVSLTFFILSKFGHNFDDTTVLLTTVGITTLVWLAVTFLTPPVDDATLDAFYDKVRPAGAGWAKVRSRSGAPPSPDNLATSLLCWVLGLAGIYAALFGTGAYLYGHVLQGVIYTVVVVVAVVWLARLTTGARARSPQGSQGG
jgi:hypothetical protein